MSTYFQAYCNKNTDLIGVLPNLEGFDQKHLVTDWQVDSGSRYRADSSGYISMLYKNGKEMGAAQTSSGDVDTNDEWYFDSANDVVYFYNSSNSPNEDRMESGVDWETLKQRVVDEQAERIRGYIPFPILQRKGVGTQSASSRDYDWIIIKSNATLACAELVRSKDQELADELEKRIIDTENDMGLLDRLKRGEYKLSFQSEGQHGIREVSINGSTTSSIVDVRGEPSVSWDVLKIQIQTGGTMTAGTSNSTVTYSVWGRDQSIKDSQIINAQLITGGWDSVGYGMSVRFAMGVLTANDEWELEVSGDRAENPLIKTAQATRI